MSTEQNKAVVRRVHEEPVNKQQLALVDELFAPDYVNHGGLPMAPGTAGLKELYTALFAAFPDGAIHIEDQLADGDKVITRWRSSATHLGTFMGVPGTGKRVTSTRIEIVRLSSGKIVEEWGEWDSLGFLQQLGVIPTLEAPAVAS